MFQQDFWSVSVFIELMYGILYNVVVRFGKLPFGRAGIKQRVHVASHLLILTFGVVQKTKPFMGEEHVKQLVFLFTFPWWKQARLWR